MALLREFQKGIIVEEISEGHKENLTTGLSEKIMTNSTTALENESSEKENTSSLTNGDAIIIPKASFTYPLVKIKTSLTKKLDKVDNLMSTLEGNPVNQLNDQNIQNQDDVLKNNPLGQFKQRLKQMELTKTSNWDPEENYLPSVKELFYSWRLLKKDEYTELCFRINEFSTIEYLLQYKNVVEFPKCMLKLTWEFCECDPSCVGELLEDYNYDSNCELFDMENLDKNNFEESCNFLRIKSINPLENNEPRGETFILKKSISSKLSELKDLFSDSENVMNCIAHQLDPTCKDNIEKCLDEVNGQNQTIIYSPIFYQARERRSLSSNPKNIFYSLKAPSHFSNNIVSSKAMGLNTLKIGVTKLPVIFLFCLMVSYLFSNKNIKICLIGVMITLMAYYSI